MRQINHNGLKNTTVWSIVTTNAIVLALGGWMLSAIYNINATLSTVAAETKALYVIVSNQNDHIGNRIDRVEDLIRLGGKK